jgi:hypothetical protein
VSRAHALSFDSDNYDRFSDNKEARMVRTARYYLLQWLATIRWTGALLAIMRNHAIPRGCRPAEPYEHNLDLTCTPTQMHTYQPYENYLPTFSRSKILLDAV